MKSRYTKRILFKLATTLIVFLGIYCIFSNKNKGNFGFENSEYFYERTGNRKINHPLLLNRDSLRQEILKLQDKSNNFNFLEEILGDDMNDGTMWYGIDGGKLPNNDANPGNGPNNKVENGAVDLRKSSQKAGLIPEEETQHKQQIVRDSRYKLVANSVMHEYGAEGVKRFDELLANGHTPIAALKILQAGGEVPKVAHEKHENPFRGSAPKVISIDEYYKIHESMLEQGVTKMPHVFVELTREGVDEAGRKVWKNLTLTRDQLQNFLADEYIQKVANPFPKSKVKPTIAVYNDSIPRPNPFAIIHDRGTKLAKDEIFAELTKQFSRRMELGDTDVTKIPEVMDAVQKSGPNKIPNIFHFIWFKCHRVKIHHYLSWLSVYRSHDPDLILFHTNCTPSGKYWENTKKSLGNKFIIVKRSPPVEVWGHSIKGVEHQSDVARLHILLEVGGVYLDDDVILLKSLERFRNESIVLGEENYDALANSIIMANPSSWFLLKWYQEYKTFNDSIWSYSSCFVPWSLWKIFPDTIRVVEGTMLRPNWEEIKYIYHELWDWSNNYSVHLYSRFMEIVDGKEERSLKEIAVLNTTYGEIARYVLWGDKTTRNITALF